MLSEQLNNKHFATLFTTADRLTLLEEICTPTQRKKHPVVFSNYLIVYLAPIQGCMLCLSGQPFHGMMIFYFF